MQNKLIQLRALLSQTHINLISSLTRLIHIWGIKFLFGELVYVYEVTPLTI